MVCIEKYIRDGIQVWPALHRYSQTSCGCSKGLKERGVYADLHVVLVDGYRRSSWPLLQIFVGVYRGELTKKGLELLSQEFDLTELDLLRARTVSGKSILDCQVESIESILPTYRPREPQPLLDILGRKNVIAHAQEIGFGLDELRGLLTSGLRWAYQTSNQAMRQHLSTIVQNLTLSESDRITYNASIFDISEQMLRDTIESRINVPAADDVVKFYLQSAKRLVRFPNESFCLSFEQAFKSKKWKLVEALIKVHPKLGKPFSGPNLGTFFSNLGCGRCKMRGDASDWRLTLCQIHRNEAISLSRVGSLEYHENDGYIDLLKQLGTDGSLIITRDWSVNIPSEERFE
ncbi:hypothetical protein FPOAC2_10145 [Fusarium poae]|uniref:hypothetical protein n=1 Tax=Fusarium poae TaxID=36050 RepID=UPI001CE8C6F0|nr:hypothetical protein FPOAC1_007450 [Fusarium poae]KAG8668084.1 hypothetical protein FPOAC1_007450 [Fusarium poae]